MITDCYDPITAPVLTLKDFYGEKNHIIDTCLIIFSKEIHDHILATFPCREIPKPGSPNKETLKIRACNGNTPIYQFRYKDKDIAFYLTSIGSACASSECYEASWITGAKSFIMFGSCGSLNGDMTKGKYIIPTESYRGEGASYYYAPPSDYISIKNSAKVAEIFTQLGVPHVLGRVWTTDSMVRETVGLVAKRRAEGCIAVEMEVAGVQAICDCYGMELYDFLESGDVLKESGYEIEGLHGANHNLHKLYLALEIAARI